MYPMMYGAQPAAGPADAHMYYAQMAGAAGAHAMPMQGAPYGMQMQQPMQMMAYGAPMGADGLADQMGGLSVQNGGVSNGGGMYHHAQMAQQRQLNGRGRGRGGYMGGFPPGYSEIPGSGVPRWGHGGGRSGGGYGGGYGGGGRGGGYGGGGSMGDDERARNGVRGLRTGAQHAVNAMGQPMMGPATMVSPEVARLKETINPAHFDCNPSYARFFIIKSYSEDDVHKSIKYGVWASTDTGNRRLDSAFREMAGARADLPVLLGERERPVLGDGADGVSARLHQEAPGCWAQDKWAGTFMIKWTFIKDIPNAQFRHILLSNNEGKARHQLARHAGGFARARCARARPARPTSPALLSFSLPRTPLLPTGKELLRIFHVFRSRTSILDDFGFYDKRQELMEARVQLAAQGLARRRRRRRRCRTRCGRSKLCSRTRCSLGAHQPPPDAAAAARRAAVAQQPPPPPDYGQSPPQILQPGSPALQPGSPRAAAGQSRARRPRAAAGGRRRGVSGSRQRSTSSTSTRRSQPDRVLVKCGACVPCNLIPFTPSCSAGGRAARPASPAGHTVRFAPGIDRLARVRDESSCRCNRSVQTASTCSPLTGHRPATAESRVATIIREMSPPPPA